MVYALARTWQGGQQCLRGGKPQTAAEDNRPEHRHLGGLGNERQYLE